MAASLSAAGSMTSRWWPRSVMRWRHRVLTASRPRPRPWTTGSRKMSIAAWRYCGVFSSQCWIDPHDAVLERDHEAGRLRVVEGPVGRQVGVDVSPSAPDLVRAAYPNQFRDVLARDRPKHDRLTRQHHQIWLLLVDLAIDIHRPILRRLDEQGGRSPALWAVAQRGRPSLRASTDLETRRWRVSGVLAPSICSTCHDLLL